MVTELLVAVVCVGANAFFVGAEFALAKVRPTALEARAKAGSSQARLAYEITQKFDAYLSATQLGITAASLGLGWLGEPALAELIAPPLHWLGLSDAVVHGIAFAIAFSVISLFHIVVGELVPKSLAIQRAERIALLCARPLQLFYYVSYPALMLLSGLSRLVLKMLGLPAPAHAEGKLSHEELKLVIQASLSERGLEGTKRELIERVLRATDRPVRAVMVPRVDMEVLSYGDDYETTMRKIRRHRFSRYPIAEDGDPDRIEGYVYVKDLLMAVRPPRTGLRDLKRDILYVPESRTVGDLLAQFQEAKIPIALVVDEYGGTAGLVTLEDILEEIVGDIQNELAVAEPRVSLVGDGRMVVDGSLPIDELSMDGLVAPAIEGAETVGGYVVATLGRLAALGDRIVLGKWEAIVEDVRDRRVHRVALIPHDPEAPPRPSNPPRSSSTPPPSQPPPPSDPEQKA